MKCHYCGSTKYSTAAITTGSEIFYLCSNHNSSKDKIWWVYDAETMCIFDMPRNGISKPDVVDIMLSANSDLGLHWYPVEV